MGIEGNWDQFPIDCQRIVDEIRGNASKAVYAAATQYAGDVQKCASTPVDTGQYRSTIRADPPSNPLEPISYVGSPMPQTRRLEFGFWDKEDRLGRKFRQPPRPHWRPTFDLNKATYLNIMAKVLEEKS